MLWESCSSSYTEHNKIRFASFGFSMILSRIYKILLKHLRDEDSFCTQTPANF
jgi:hypothetical protein